MLKVQIYFVVSKNKSNTLGNQSNAKDNARQMQTSDVENSAVRQPGRKKILYFT